MAFPQHMDRTEQRIVGKLIRKALALGYLVSVYDGEEWALVKADDYKAITAEVAATDETTLRFRLASGEKVGSVWLVHGNEDDVISDCSDNAATLALCEGVY
ncbi:hypothetical protein U8C32_08695 [Sinorhizobium medicae]|uniref:hypothetical protein n=1 Tax=Sinorhizobium medicae TaxID=110321 RepID=UPI00299F0018|nr:hypothetical protein [Sinorhizobium medicae]MDX0762392.1 hypothetical protein [Sinorhizobium medicae]MDX0823489.1 hypothetical protein [Sinorhizobium medicae]WQO63865.1 hypothetical protein U8C40_11750 [Sinorhizobium medicae]WQO93631.1 hypothetical protein U8C32_08695 [Sinorhizobium medicae]